jgi:hypothetical protein
MLMEFDQQNLYSFNSTSFHTQSLFFDFNSNNFSTNEIRDLEILENSNKTE